MFSLVEAAPPIKVFQLTADYTACLSSPKYNLGVGAYRTNDGLPYVLNVVRECEKRIADDFTLNHEYLAIDGLASFTSAAAALAFGRENPVIVNKRYIGFQALGGTGALRLAAEFMHQCLNRTAVYSSKPTWPNHHQIFRAAGFTDIKEYRYWDPETRNVDFSGLMEDLENAPSDSVIILHAVAHNPTGRDLSAEQWEQVSDLVARRKLLVVMDNAYQGFASGSIERDGAAVILMAKKGVEFFVAQSFSKNFGLYNERVGNLITVLNDSGKVEAVKSQQKRIARTLWSNPPSYGARIVAMTLNDDSLYQQWKSEVNVMATRIKDMRQLLYEKLKVHEISWDHIIEQIGMFSYTGLNVAQVRFVREKFSTFLMDDGRINMCALTTNNAQYIADAIAAAVKQPIE
jgi:aspartate aminotransferase